MILPQSNLRLVKFDVLDVHVGYISPDSLDELDYSKYVVDLDFTVTIGESKGYIFVYTNVKVNDVQTKFPCHVIDIDAGSVFQIKGNVSKEMRDTLIKNSAIPIAFNNVRGFIQNITSYIPIGSYTLPLFTISDLINNEYINKAKKIRTSTVEKVIKKKSPRKKS